MIHRSIYFLFPVTILAVPACQITDLEEKRILQPIIIEINHLDEILPINDTLVPPILYHDIKGLDSLSPQENKEKFIAIVLPAILVAKHRLGEEQQMISQLKKKAEWSLEDSVQYTLLAERFNSSSLNGLIQRMETHPVSIVIAQAAVESGWGTSRFFGEANNLFGIWSYKTDEPRVAASIRKDNNTVYVRKYDTISDSILDYFETIARSRAYRKFREERNQTDDIDLLLPYLRNYSSRRDEYVAQLKTIINQNDLTKYDSYQLDPKYFVNPEVN